MQRIGFVGLGIMGRGMAATLLKAGYDVTVFNRTRAKAEEMGTLGAKVADTPAEAARGAEVVIAMLADPPAVESAVLAPGGVIEGLERGAILIDCSTVSPACTAATCRAAAARGAGFLDSPVAGSRTAAEQGELILMVGGDADTIEKARAVLEVVSKKIIHAGSCASGTNLKLCFNLVVAHMGAALCESLVLGAKSGLAPETIIETLMSAIAGSRLYEWKGGCIMDRDFTTNFSVKLLNKDLDLMMSAGYDLGVPLPVTAATKEFFAMAKGHGEAEEDFCAAVKVLEDLAGVEVRRSQA